METNKDKVISHNHKSKYKSDLKTRCYAFSLSVIKVTDSLPQKRSAWVISDQLIRSATSVGANLVEATAASSRQDFKKFHVIALKSANETKYWLGLLRDSGLCHRYKIDPLLSEVEEISSMIAAGVLKMSGKKDCNL